MYTRLPVWAPVAGGRPAVPRGAQGRRPRRDRRDRRRLRRGGGCAASTAGFDGIELQCSHSLDRARLPVAGHQPAHRRVRRQPREPGPAPARDRGRGARGDRARPGPRRAAVRRRADRGRHHHRRDGRGRPGRRGPGPGRLHQHLDRRGHRVAVHDRGVDAHPARVRAVHPVGAAQGRRPAGGRRRAGSRTRSRPSGRWPRATPTSSASCGARSPTPTSRPRPGPAATTTSACASRATRSASGAWASTAGSAASRTRVTGREAVHRPVDGQAVRRGRARRSTSWSSAPDRAGCRPRSPPPSTATASPCSSATTRPGGQVRWAARVPNRAEFGDLVRNQVHECGRLGVEIRTGTEATAELVDGAAPRRRDRGHRVDAGPTLVGAAAADGSRARRGGACPVIDVTDVLTGRVHAERSRDRDRRGRLPPGHERGRAAGRPGLPGRDAEPGHGRRARTSASPSTWRTGGCGPRARASCR